MALYMWASSVGAAHEPSVQVHKFFSGYKTTSLENKGRCFCAYTPRNVNIRDSALQLFEKKFFGAEW